MGICLEQWRVAVGLFHRCKIGGHHTFLLNINPIWFVRELLKNVFLFFNMFCGKFHRLLDASILNYQFSIIMILLLSEAGDVERNPGPNPDHTLSFLHLNIRSIRNKIDFLKDNFMDFEVLCFSETHLDITVSSESLGISDCYSNPYRKDRNSHGGGLLMYINTSLAHKRRPDLEIFCDESIWAELKVKQEIYLIGLFYSPTTADQTFFNNFNVNIERALEISNNLILVGDLNEDLLNINYRNLRDILLINSLQNVISSPTRQNAILDPILIHEDMPYCDSGVIDTPANISDHKATFLIIPFDYEIKTSYTRLIWLYKKANFENLKYKLSTQNWDCLTEGSIEEACTTFTNIFLDMVKTCIPSKEITVRPDDKPWYDHEIRHFTLKRDRVKRKLTKSCSNVLREQYKHLRNKVNNLKKHAKEKFYNNLESSITDFYSNDRKQFWKTIRYFVKNNNSTTSIPPLKSTLPNGQITTCYTDYEKAECLNEYFASISTINDDNCQLPTFEFKCLNRLSNISCSVDEIKTLIDILNPNKASGPDGISNKMLKPVAQEVAQPLSILFNRSFREGKFAESWKHSNVIPLPKKGDKSEPSNFRPVSLLSGLGKLQERIAFKHIHNYLIENNLIYKYQSGFLPGHSTTFQLIDIYHHICQAIDNSQYACMVFCDVSKAFDRVWHRGLIFKLKQIGINGNLLEWVSNYLNNRQQRVVPTYITDLIPPVIRETTNYPLRNQNNITTPYCRTELFKKSCIPSSISLWNSANDNLRNCPSIDSFKFNLKKESTLTKVPIYYTYGDRFLSVMHARIRNKCSNLSNDLCLNHLTQNPFCSCNSEIENAEHYFFRCPKYVNERITMFRETHSFHPLNLNKLLTGDSNLTIENNAKIFEAVQKYIKNTKRFSNT